MARFTLEVLKGAREKRDQFCLHLFYLAGWYLGRSIVGICAKADPVSRNYSKGETSETNDGRNYRKGWVKVAWSWSENMGRCNAI